jgi:hypothetical protein
MSTHDTIPELEERLRAALTARADLVQPEDLAPFTRVVELRPRWQSPWVLLATAAVVLLVLGVVVQGLGRDQRSDDVAPKPDTPRPELPQDIGRDWKADDISSPARLDLDGDGVKEKVELLAEPTKGFDGRIRLQTTLSSTGEESYGIAELGSTIGTSPLDPIDADGDGDQELVLLHENLGGGGPGSPHEPVVFDLRDGLLVEAVVEQPDLLASGTVPVPDSQTRFYDLVRIHGYWFEDGVLRSSRSVDSFARGNMTLYRGESIAVDTWKWHLDADGVLRPTPAGCMLEGPEALVDCGPDEQGDLPVVQPVARDSFGEGEQAAYGDENFGFTARVEDGTLLVDGVSDGTLTHPLGSADARVLTTQPTAIFYDGASFVVTYASDPTRFEVLVQRTEGLRRMEPVGQVPLLNEGEVRTWLTANGALVTAVADGDAWQTWQWEMVSGAKIAPMPTGTVCFDDVDDPATARPC